MRRKAASRFESDTLTTCYLKHDSFAEMPHAQQSKLAITELHPLFAAEVRGVDFSKDIPDDTFAEILAAIAKVGASQHLAILKVLSRDSMVLSSFHRRDWMTRVMLLSQHGSESLMM